MDGAGMRSLPARPQARGGKWNSARDRLGQRPGPPGLQERHSGHYADANEGEVTGNNEFIHAVELLFSPETGFPRALAVTVFADVLIEARKLECLEERGLIFEISNV